MVKLEVDSMALRNLLLHGLHVALGMEALLVPLQLELHALPHLGAARCTQIALRLHSDCTQIALRLHSDCTRIALGLHSDCTQIAIRVHSD